MQQCILKNNDDMNKTPIEYKGYLITVTATERHWGFSFGEWSGSYRVWQEGNPVPIVGVIDGNETSTYEAEQRTLRVVKVAIDEAITKSNEQLLLSLSRLGENFVL